MNIDLPLGPDRAASFGVTNRVRWLLARSVLLGIPASCALLGYVSSRGDGLVALAVVAGAIALYALVRGGRAVVAGVIVVAALSGIPVLNIQNLNIHGSFQATDICAIALIAMGLRGLYQSSQRMPASWRLLLAASSIGLTIAWAQAVIHAADHGASLKSAALFGRDFLFFAILLPLAPYIVSSRREINRFVVTLAVLTTIFSCTLIAASVHLVPTSIANAYLVHTVGSFARVYTRMQDLIALGFACSLGFVVLGGRRHRFAGVMMLLACTVAVILMFTRALYIGLIAGVVVGVLIWGVGYSRPSAAVRKRMTMIVIGIVLIVVALVAFDPSLFESAALQAIVKRFSAGVENIQGQGAGTLELRERLATLELQLLGGHWLFGLGFLPPSVFYVPELPLGSIRDVDLGLLQAVVTMGIVGTVFVFVPVLATAMRLARPLRRAAGQLEWLRLGVFVWLVSVIASSLTLDTLFGETGSLLSAVVIGVAARAHTIERAEMTAERAMSAPQTTQTR
jgi:hypothetical protein